MPSLTRYQAPSLALVLLGLGLVVSLLVTFPHAGQQEYHHEVQPVDESQVEETYYSQVLTFGELSPQGKEVFRQTMNSDGGEHVVYGDSNAPDDWNYPTDTGPGLAYVEYNGSYYELETSAGSFEAVFGFAVALVGLFGLGIAAVGGLGLRREQPRAPATILVIFASTAALVVLGRYVPPSSRDVFAVVGAGVVGAVAAGTWLLLGRRWRTP
ncbi:hypothetical protein SAMN05216559_3919 [Halomicrobium zhouii]|uniref:DUF7979 domain-containing protein n=1 Tax=Halomicrobium zhouii TaxID=767519 RepID=A0A1I6M7I4_9EURY|nr:hypothetical protein [Halomicrobium zhouii]SFS11669.1 hypothetical protein SAMN05216559_3919 [Halomicrobium zhouii]